MSSNLYNIDPTKKKTDEKPESNLYANTHSFVNKPMHLSESISFVHIHQMMIASIKHKNHI